MIFVEPTRLNYLFPVRNQITRSVLNAKRNHNIRWERPRLRTEVAQILNLYRSFFTNLSTNSIPKILAHIHKSSYECPVTKFIMSIALK